MDWSELKPYDNGNREYNSKLHKETKKRKRHESKEKNQRSKKRAKPTQEIHVKKVQQEILQWTKKDLEKGKKPNDIVVARQTQESKYDSPRPNYESKYSSASSSSSSSSSSSVSAREAITITTTKTKTKTKKGIGDLVTIIRRGKEEDDDGDNCWLEKYKPKSSQELIHDPFLVNQFCLWLKNFDLLKSNAKKIAFVCGPPGVGKSTFVNLLLEEQGFFVQTVNFAEVERLKQESGETNGIVVGKKARPLKEQVQDVVYSKKGFLKKALVLDSIDCSSASFHESSALLRELLFLQRIYLPKTKRKKKEQEEQEEGEWDNEEEEEEKQEEDREERRPEIRYPLICIVESLTGVLKTFKDKAAIFMIKKLNSRAILSRLKQVCLAESLQFTPTLQDIEHLAEGDLRFALLWLEFWHSNSSSSLIPATKPKEKKDSIINRKTFHNDVFWQARFLLLDSNIPSVIKLSELFGNDEIRLLFCFLFENFIKASRLLQFSPLEELDNLSSISTLFSDMDALKGEANKEGRIYGMEENDNDSNALNAANLCVLLSCQATFLGNGKLMEQFIQGFPNFPKKWLQYEKTMKEARLNENQKTTKKRDLFVQGNKNKDEKGGKKRKKGEEKVKVFREKEVKASSQKSFDDLFYLKMEF